ncbi:MAG: MBL fold metallo-hydrolase [Dermatophilaceae bacterium]
MGGHTSCVSIAHDDGPACLLLDAGTGITRTQPSLGAGPFRGTVILGHLHWDHVIGLPFFEAGDREDARVDLLLPAQGQPAESLLARLMSPPLFPITPSQLRGTWTFDTYDEGHRDCEGFAVRALEIPHGGGRTMGLRVSDGTHVLAYLSDHAPQFLGPGRQGVGELHRNALELAAGADLLIHDAQYTAAELARRGNFGHAAAEYAVLLAREAGVRGLLLSHHDPARTDAEVVALTAAAQAWGRPGLTVGFAREDLVLDLSSEHALRSIVPAS